MKFYIDNDYCCHATNADSNFREVEHPFFDGKCPIFIEGFRFVPPSESWTRSDGIVFKGEMISVRKPCNELAAAQAQYEADLAEAAAAYQEGVDSAYEQ